MPGIGMDALERLRRAAVEAAEAAVTSGPGVAGAGAGSGGSGTSVPETGTGGPNNDSMDDMKEALMQQLNKLPRKFNVYLIFIFKAFTCNHYVHYATAIFASISSLLNFNKT